MCHKIPEEQQAALLGTLKTQLFHEKTQKQSLWIWIIFDIFPNKSTKIQSWYILI